MAEQTRSEISHCPSWCCQVNVQTQYFPSILSKFPTHEDQDTISNSAVSTTDRYLGGDDDGPGGISVYTLSEVLRIAVGDGWQLTQSTMENWSAYATRTAEDDVVLLAADQPDSPG